jgi:hypothetical protein
LQLPLCRTKLRTSNHGVQLFQSADSSLNPSTELQQEIFETENFALYYKALQMSHDVVFQTRQKCDFGLISNFSCRHHRCQVVCSKLLPSILSAKIAEMSEKHIDLSAVFFWLTFA